MFWSVFRQILCRIELKADKDSVVFNSQENIIFSFPEKKIKNQLTPISCY